MDAQSKSGNKASRNVERHFLSPINEAGADLHDVDDYGDNAFAKKQKRQANAAIDQNVANGKQTSTMRNSDLGNTHMRKTTFENPSTAMQSLGGSLAASVVMESEPDYGGGEKQAAEGRPHEERKIIHKKELTLVSNLRTISRGAHQINAESSPSPASALEQTQIQLPNKLAETSGLQITLK